MRDMQNGRINVNYYPPSASGGRSAQVEIIADVEGEKFEKVNAAIKARGACGELTAMRVLSILADNTARVSKAIGNDQATILFWDDGEKTVVKCRECGDGRCLFDKDMRERLERRKSDADSNASTDEDREELVDLLRRSLFCDLHFDSEKAVMAAMLKRLYPNFQDVLRAIAGDEDE
ncbi:hypothetical protein [Adlercreutzia sp. ZJ242]|uniref:hypothetical protein n=1 Tax=Adlercreutzia sp. ZJ242 TaxID=2709409 RepID=UPI0013ECC59C|nr:hypothetical protein [Adlercreutzia sp. ZJ242]